MSYFDRARLLKRTPQPYPDACDSIGNKIGLFHEKLWWHVQGKALEEYKAVRDDILAILDQVFEDTYHNAVCVHLFMIGRCETKARPFVMIFCVDKDIRKKAKKAIENSGLMAKLPGFQTGHAAVQPGIGALVQPAAEEPHVSQIPVSITTTDVYFDSGDKHHALYTPVFARQDDGSFRRAIAFLVYQQGRSCLMSVAHIFVGISIDKRTIYDPVDDSDFDIGSDTDGDGSGEDDMDVTSRASISSFEDNPAMDSDSASPESGSSIWMSSVDAMDVDAPEEDHCPPAMAKAGTDLNRIVSQPTSLMPLGKVFQVSTDHDWALIAIADETLASRLEGDVTKKYTADSHESIGVDEANVVVYNQDDDHCMHGTLRGCTTLLRLPQSSAFQEFFQVDLTSTLAWGACGSLVLNATTNSIYGHIVASSATRHVAFVAPARDIFKDKDLLSLASHVYAVVQETRTDEFSTAHTRTSQQQVIAADGPHSTAIIRARHPPVLNVDLDQISPFFKKQDKGSFHKSAQYYPSPPFTDTNSISSHASSPTIAAATDSDSQFGDSVTSALLRYTVPPFVSIGKNIDPFKTTFQSNHPSVSLEELKSYFDRYFGTEAMAQHWIPKVLETPHTFLSTLCVAASFHDVVHGRLVESVQTIALRQEVMHHVGQNMLDSGTRSADHNLIAIAHLISSELISGEQRALSWHEDGFEAMVRSRGGLQRLDSRLASTISWLMLECAILRDEIPRRTFREYCATHSRVQEVSETHVLLNSPLYWILADYTNATLSKDTKPSTHTTTLLHNIHMLISVLRGLSQDGGVDPYFINALIVRVVSDVDLPTYMINDETALHRHRAIYLVGWILCTAVDLHVPLSKAVKDFTSRSSRRKERTRIHGLFIRYRAAADLDDLENLLQKLQQTLELSDTSDCWDQMVGVLFWISLTAGAASCHSAKPLRQYFSALTVRISFKLCFAYPEALHETLMKMSDLINTLHAAAEENIIARDIAAKTRASILEGDRNWEDLVSEASGN